MSPYSPPLPGFPILITDRQVVLFYLILRGLDTVEDDMTLPIEKKDKMLREFYIYLDSPGWNFTESNSILVVDS